MLKAYGVMFCAISNNLSRIAITTHSNDPNTVLSDDNKTALSKDSQRHRGIESRLSAPDDRGQGDADCEYAHAPDGNHSADQDRDEAPE